MMSYVRMSALTFIALFLGVISFATLPPKTTHAEEVLETICLTNPNATACKDNQVDQNLSDNSIYGPNGVLGKAARMISIVVGIVSVIMIIISGIQYILSSGDPARLNKAKDTLIYAMIGMTIALIARAIIAFVLNKL